MQSAERSSRLQRQKGYSGLVQTLAEPKEKKCLWLWSLCMFRWQVDPDELLKQWKVCLLSLLERWYFFSSSFVSLSFHFLSFSLSFSHPLTHVLKSHRYCSSLLRLYSMHNTGHCWCSDCLRELCLGCLCFPGVELTSHQNVGVQQGPAFYMLVNVCD